MNEPSALISSDDSSVDDNLLGSSDVDDDVDLNFALLESWNITDNQELQCLIKFVGEPYPPLDYTSDLFGTSDEDSGVSDSGLLFCNRTWDSVLCWPTTVAGSTAALPCNFELNGVKYDSSREYLN